MEPIVVYLDNVAATKEQLLDKLYEIEQLEKEETLPAGTTCKIAVIGGYRVVLDRDSVIAAAKELEENHGLAAVLTPRDFRVTVNAKSMLHARKVGPISIVSK